MNPHKAILFPENLLFADLGKRLKLNILKNGVINIIVEYKKDESR